MIYFYVNSTTGVDEVDSGTQEKPFKTLDYCINQLHTRNIKRLKLKDEEKVLFLFNSQIDTLDEKIENEKETYLNNILSKAYEDDVTIYLDNGEYEFNNKKAFTGGENKTLNIIGKGKNTRLYNLFHSYNSSHGEANFSISFKKLIWDNIKQPSTSPNVWGFNGGTILENILFLNIPDNGYAFFVSYENSLDMKYCVKPEESTSFIRNGDSGTKSSNIIGCYGYFSMGYSSSYDKSTIIDSKIIERDGGEVQLDDDYHITDPSVDTSKTGLYVGEYSWVSQDCLIKINDKYYSILEEFWDTEIKQFKEVGSLDFEKSFDLSLLTKKVTYGEDTFIPLDKFDNFSIVFKEKDVNKLNINGYKLENTIVITNPIDLRMVENFTSMDVNGNNVKCLLKINDKNKYYSYNFEENELQEQDITNISTNGLDISKIKDIDFNKIKESLESNLKNITFAFYLEQDSIVNNIIIDYLEVGEFSQKASNYTNLKVGYKKITIKPTFNANLLKINVL